MNRVMHFICMWPTAFKMAKRACGVTCYYHFTSRSSEDWPPLMFCRNKLRPTPLLFSVLPPSVHKTTGDNRPLITQRNARAVIVNGTPQHCTQVGQYLYQIKPWPKYQTFRPISIWKTIFIHYFDLRTQYSTTNVWSFSNVCQQGLGERGKTSQSEIKKRYYGLTLSDVSSVCSFNHKTYRVL